MPETQVMSKSDRMELRRVVKARFELLREQLEVRAAEVQQMIKQKVEKDHQKAITEIEEESTALLKEVEGIFTRIHKLHTKAKRKGLSGSSLKEYHEARVRDSLKGWSPANLNQKVNTIVGKMKGEKGVAGLDLRGQELTLLENLSVDALDSKEARDFLEKVPTVDNLLPLPKEKATLKA